MENQTNGSQFREDEVTVLSHWSKQEEQWVKTVYPKICGRLRLAHEDNEQLNIETKIVQYDQQIAIVKAIATTAKGKFTGIGMASVERDEKIAPAILELAETRSIARALRFAGFGMESCSAEEISHLENCTGDNCIPQKEHPPHPQEKPNGGNGDKHSTGGNGDTAKITSRQKDFLDSLRDGLSWTETDLENEAIKIFGTKVAFLSVKNASQMIDHLKRRSETPLYN